MTTARPPSIRAVVEEWLEQERPDCVDAAALDRLRSYAGRRRGAVPSKRSLVEALLTTSARIDRRLGGLPLDLRDRVRLRAPDAAARSLVDLSAEYERANQAGDAERAEDCRRAARRAGDRLSLLLRRKLSPEKRREKEEIRTWLLTWLRDPTIFPAWIEIRRRAQGL